MPSILDHDSNFRSTESCFKFITTMLLQLLWAQPKQVWCCMSSAVSSGPDRSPPPCEPAGIFELLNNLYRIPSDLCVYKIICMVRKTLALYVSYFIEMFKVTTGLVLHVALYFHGLFSTNSGSDRSPPRKPDGVLEIPKTFSRIPSINSM